MSFVILRRAERGEESPKDKYLKKLLKRMPNKMMKQISMSRLGRISIHGSA